MALADSRKRGPELLEDLTDKTENLLLEQANLTQDVARKVAESLADLMRHDWGGQLIYFAKGLSIDVSKRDLEFFNKWDGTPDHLAKLALEYDISVQYAYRVVKAVRVLETARRQSDMFPDN